MNRQVKISLSFKNMLLGSLLLNSSLMSYATCNSYITNDSNKVWSVVFKPFKYENVDFINANRCANPKNGPCIINPGETLNIHYTTNGKHIDGSAYLTVVGSAPNPQIELLYSNYKTSGINRLHCPRLRTAYNEGDTGDVEYVGSGAIAFYDSSK